MGDLILGLMESLLLIYIPEVFRSWYSVLGKCHEAGIEYKKTSLDEVQDGSVLV